MLWMKDPDVEALRRLVASKGGHTAVADAIDASDQTIYQIVSGQLLPSGNPKGVGPSLRKRLDAKFPGWRSLNVAVSTPSLPGVDHRVSLELRYAGSTRTAARVPVRGTAKMGAEAVIDWADLIDPAGVVDAYSVTEGAYAVRVSGDALHPYAAHGSCLVIEPNSQCVAGEPVIVHMRNNRSAVRELVSARDDVVVVQGIVDRRRETFNTADVRSVEPISAVVSASKWRPAGDPK